MQSQAYVLHGDAGIISSSSQDNYDVVLKL